MNNEIKNRYEFVFLFDVKDGNPNGDPDAGNMPRIDPETGNGLVTDVCLKRKIRNYTQIIHEGKSPYRIYIKEKAVLTLTQKEAYDALDKEKVKDMSDIEQARFWMCKNFYDIRTFGAVMSLKEFNCGQVRGPVQLGFARSIDQIFSAEHTITRMAVATKKEAEKQDGDNRTMGRKFTVPYGLYRVHGYISASLAKQTGFSEEDLKFFWEALMNIFDHDRSAARGEMSSCKLIVFKHQQALGNVPAQKLFNLVKITRTNNDPKPPRNFSDYNILIDHKECPKGIEIIEMI